MPRDQVVDGVTLRGIPDEVSPDDPALKARAGQIKLTQEMDKRRFERENRGHMSAQARLDKAAEMAMEPAPGADPADPGQHPSMLFENLGAGLTDLWNSAKQVTGLGEQPTPEELREKRMRDAALAKASYGEFLGEQVQDVGRNPLAAIPTEGMLSNAVQAGLSGAARPTLPGESRAINTVGGTLLGGASPYLFGTARKVDNIIRPEANAKREAQAEIDELTRNLSPETRERMTSQPPATGSFEETFPFTPAARANDPNMARAERASRARNPAAFREGDIERGRHVSRAVQDSTKEAEQLQLRKDAANDGWKKDWDAVEQVIDPEAFKGNVGFLREHLEDLKLHKDAEDPDVRSMLDYLTKRYDELTAKGKLTPGHVQEWRRLLNKAGGNPQSQNAFTRLDPSSVAIGRLKNDLDELLNTSSNNAWQTVLDNYTINSRLIDRAKAAGQVRQKWWELTPGDPEMGLAPNMTGRVRGEAIDTSGAREVPRITEDALSKGMDLAINKKTGGTMLSPEAHQGLSQTLAVLNRQRGPTELGKTGGLGNSTTTMDWTAMLDEMASGALPKIGGALWPPLATAMKERAEKAGGLQKSIVDEALADPAALKRMLDNPMLRPELRELLMGLAAMEPRLYSGDVVTEHSQKQ